MSGGGLCLIDTPLQREKGIRDSAELAEKDFLSWGQDADPEWVRLYVKRSREDIHDWLSNLGVKFDTLFKRPGNSVARFHLNAARGLGVVLPIYQDCLRYRNIRFLWNTEVIQLQHHDGRVDSVTVQNLRSQQKKVVKAAAVIVATGGFQSNLKLVQSSWPKGSEFPEEILIGSGLNAKGSGLTLGREVGAAITRLDHQWNYPWGIRDPQRLKTGRGLTVELRDGIWVNSSGRRFVNENLNARDALTAVIAQHGHSYWGILDDIGKRSFFVRGTGWESSAKVERLILGNSEVTKKANDLRELANMAGIPADELERSIARWNRLVDEKSDADFGRFGATMPDPMLLTGWPSPPSRRIEKPPFYAIHMYPISRKSLGGLQIDHQCRVLDASSKPISGLYAVGEVTGFGGINGSAGLEGTFLGPSMLQGRIVGEQFARGRSLIQPAAVKSVAPSASRTECTACHNINVLSASGRRAFEHSSLAHTFVRDRNLSCDSCHREMAPYQAGRHTLDRLALSATCATCHLAQE